ncbi:MAG: response regulator transcription factor [Spirochaetia bacterium]|nr:response regulator transcription factor [Spirochaetia bacterium]
MKKTDLYKIGLIEDEKKFQDHFKKAASESQNIQEVIIWNSCEIFLSDKTNHNIDLLYLDINLPHMNGIDLLIKLNEMHYMIPVVMLTSLDKDETIFRCIELGASGYIYKSDLHNLSETTNIIMKSGAIISPSIALRVLNNFRKPETSETLEKLSDREKQVLDLTINGMSAAEAAKVLHISVHTFRNHTKNIYSKLNVKNKVQLMKRVNSK